MSIESEMRQMHPESTGGVKRRAFLQMVAGAATGAALVGGMPRRAAAQMAPGPRGGHLYMQTNEIKNAIIHYRWAESGTLTEVERVPTGGAGSGTFKPISGQESAPNAFEVGYATHPDGSLEEITRVTIPYNSPQGLVGF